MSVHYYATVELPVFTNESPAAIIRVINDEHGITVESFNGQGEWEEDYELYKPIVAGDPSKVAISETEAEAIIARWSNSRSAAMQG